MNDYQIIYGLSTYGGEIHSLAAMLVRAEDPKSAREHFLDYIKKRNLYRKDLVIVKVNSNPKDFCRFVENSKKGNRRNSPLVY